MVTGQSALGPGGRRRLIDAGNRLDRRRDEHTGRSLPDLR
jgi:hypothetical protein